MTRSIELFEKWDGKWRPLSLASFTGKKIRKEIWESMQGKEIIGKLTQGGTVIGYVAGTEELRGYYAEKTGLKTWGWEEAAAMMEMKGSSLIDDTDEILSGVLDVFGDGCQVMRVNYQ